MTLALLLAWTLPWAAGVAVFCALTAPRLPGWVAAALGHGLVLGLLLAALAVDLFARSDTAHALQHAGMPLALFAMVCAIAAARRLRHAPGVAREPWANVHKWKIALALIALASLVWRGWLAAREIMLRPTFPWDAWDAWAVKSKVWFLLGHYAPFVSMHDWADGPSAEIFTGPAWSYPSALSWMQVWLASVVGSWIEPIVNLPWLVLWCGMLLGHYGQWRALGVARMPALAFVYFLGSLPLLVVHVALAGYADLWLACVFGFAVLAWLRWREQHDYGQLLLAVLCAIALPWLKLEGAVWLLLFAGWAGYSSLPRRWRRYALGAFGVLALIGAAVGRLMLPLFGLGWVHVELTSITIPVIGTLAIGWHEGAFAGAATALFAQPNWHLLWWIAPALVVWRWRELLANRALLSLLVLLLAGFAFLAFLFLFTDAARWAESYTAINRLVMHLVPAALTLLALLYRELPAIHRDTAPASAPLRDSV